MGILSAGAMIAFGASNCASPTQIIIDVRAEKALCSGAKMLRSTGIVVTTPEKVDTEALDIFEQEPGCGESGSVGRLTITPSGENDANIGVRIVAGIDMEAQQCRPPLWEGCILARRYVRFTPHRTITVTVILSEGCIGMACGKDECDKGACVKPDEIQLDGGLTPIEDASSDRSSPEDGGEDANLDGGVDACIGCPTGATCDGTTHECTIDCVTNVNCNNKALCGQGLDCVFTCGSNSCTNVQCPPGAASCRFNCQNANACVGVNCAASGSCVVACPNPGSCRRVFMDAGKSQVTCTSDTDVTCDNVHCTGTGADGCKRSCGAGAVACGDASTCAPPNACGQWALADGGP